MTTLIKQIMAVMFHSLQERIVQSFNLKVN
jgi:hypothetical protein